MPAGAEAVAGAAVQLWQRLDPDRWPLPLAALPPGTVLVGGAVRDGLLGRLAEQPDLDLVVPQGAIRLCRSLARQLGGSAVVLDAERDIARLVVDGWCFDLAAQEGNSLESDLQRRDFDANAIALPLQGKPALLDPTGGIASLRQRQLRAISEANLTSDPLRLLRGLRLACELDFQLDARSLDWIERHRASLASVASERVLAELEKLAVAPRGEQGLLAVLGSGLLEPWLPLPTALQPQLERLNPALAGSLGLSPGERSWALPLARLSALADAPALARLHSSRNLQKRVQPLREALTLLAGRPLNALEESQRFALQRSLEPDLPALLLLCPDQIPPTLLERWRDAEDPLCHPRPPLDGRTLQQHLGLPPGPQLGRLLQHLSQERAFGRLAAAAPRAEVLQRARRWLDQPLPPPP